MFGCVQDQPGFYLNWGEFFTEARQDQPSPLRFSVVFILRWLWGIKSLKVVNLQFCHCTDINGTAWKQGQEITIAQPVTASHEGYGNVNTAGCFSCRLSLFTVVQKGKDVFTACSLHIGLEVGKVWGRGNWNTFKQI